MNSALREQIRQRMSPPNRESVAEIARATGITMQTLYNWRSQWKTARQLCRLEPPAGAVVRR